MGESCKKCVNYTEDIGQRGYCKLYHHETSTTEVVCPRFEQKNNKEWKSVLNIDKVKDLMMTDTSKILYNQSKGKTLYSLSVICTAILSILLLTFSVTLCAVLAAFADVITLHKVIFIMVVGAFVISIIVILCMMISKFKVVRIIIPILTLLLIILMLVFSGEVWFDFHIWIMKLSETVFNI